MKTYNIISPSIDGVLSDDALYFEGVNRPQAVYKLRDGGEIDRESLDVLEKYFNDVYNLLLRKISAFTMHELTDSEEELKMQALLQELIKVKRLILKGTIK
jgi:hypothetical protein